MSESIHSYHHGTRTRRRLPLWALAAAVVCVLGAPVQAQEDEEADRVRDFLEEEHALSMEFETPHTPWARPYAGGRTRVVFIAPWYQGSTHGREMVELMQRFDLEAHAVYVSGGRLVGDGRPDWYGGDPEAGTHRALCLLGRPDTVVFVNEVKAETLPEAVRDRIRAGVEAGGGLVLVGDDLEVPFPNAQPLEAGKLVCGRGRIRTLPSRDKLEFAPGWEAALDYQMAEQGRGLLWAAGRDPQSGLTIEVPGDPIARAHLHETALRVRWNPDAEMDHLQVRLRRDDGTVCDLGTHPAAGGTLDLSLPTVAGGAYWVDVRATNGAGAVDWAVAPLTVDAGGRLESLSLDRDWAEPGDAVAGSVKRTGDAAGILSVLVKDRFGRILVRQDCAADASFSIRAEPWMPMLVWVEAVLADEQGEISVASVPLRITNRGRDRFNFVMWNYPGGDLAPYGLDSFARYGVTSVLQQGPPHLAMAASNLTYVPYAASFRASSRTTTAMLDPATGLLKTGCVHDPEGMSETVRQVVEASRTAREHGVFAYSLGDENAVRASCLGPHCLAAYRRYLEEVYGDIAALNRSWESAYASFGDIELLAADELPAPDAPDWFLEYFAERQLLHRTDTEGAKGDDLDKQVDMGNINDEMRALQAGNFARWYDRQAFQNWSYVEWCKQFQSAFLEIDPQAWTGFEGTDSFSIRKLTTRTRQGGDVDLFVRELDYFGPYTGPANELVRSIAPAGYPMGNWIGYDPEADKLLGQYWSQVCDRMNTIQWWRWDNLDGYHGYLMPTLAPFPAVKDLLEDTQVVRAGLGDVLMDADLEDDGIAMLYSLPSTYIAHFDGNDTYGDYNRDHAVWHRLVHDAGLQFRYVTDRMLRLGEFNPGTCKVLILPLAFAMSPQEAEAVRAFVDGGGTIIADVRPATYDGHCKPLDQGLLDDVFGIARTGKRHARVIDRLGVQGEVAGRPVAMRWGNWHGKDIYPQMKVDPTVAATTGRALGEAYFIHFWTGLKAPVCVVNEYGKGRAILLNFAIFDAPASSLVRDLLAAAGAEPAVALARAGGGGAKGVETTRWRNGPVELLAFLTDSAQDLQVSLPGPRWVYNLKTGQDLGKTETFEAPLKAHRAAFYALLPGPAQAPAIDLPSPVVDRGAVATARVRLPYAEGRHAVTVRVTDPQGHPAPGFGGTLSGGGEGAVVELPFAFNDPPGHWTLHATDLYSRTTAQATVEVR